MDDKLDVPLDQIIENDKKNLKRRNRERKYDSPYDKPTKRNVYQSHNRSNVGCRVYVGNLAWETSWQDLKDHMKQVGHVEFVNIFSNGKYSKGCGVVEFANPDAAKRAINELNDTTIKDTTRPIFVREDREEDSNLGSKEDETCRQLFVDNLPYSAKWYDLKDHFKQYGEVLKADVILSRDGRSAGRGTVLFSSSRDVKRAINEANETFFQGRKLFLKEDKYA